MRPDSIRKFDMFYLASLATGLASSLMNYETQSTELARVWGPLGLGDYASGFILGVGALGLAINLLLWFFASRQRMGWVKWVLVVFVAFTGISMLFALAIGEGSISITAVLTTLLKGIATWFLFQQDAKEWFAAKAG